MRVCLPRFPVLELTENVARFHAEVKAAAMRGCKLVIFPEQFLTGYTIQVEVDEILRQFAAASTEAPELLLCCGTISSERHNRQVWYKAGRRVAHYDKVHLFKPNREDELWSPGDVYVALETDGLRIGLGTCNDVRFPDQMQTLSRQGRLHLLVYPALWPASRDHIWASLLRARAIEHGAFALGCCVSLLDNKREQMQGAGNWVFDPLGDEVQPDGCDFELDLSRLKDVLVDTQAEFRSVERVAKVSVDN